MTSKPTGSNAVQAFLDALDHPLKAVIEDSRAALIGPDPRITEHIKWKAPSFCFDGEDRVTVNVHGERIRYVFHRGAKVKDSTGFSFHDPARLLQWAAVDRAVLTVTSLAQWDMNRDVILALIRDWMRATA